MKSYCLIAVQWLALLRYIFSENEQMQHMRGDRPSIHYTLLRGMASILKVKFASESKDVSWRGSARQVCFKLRSQSSFRSNRVVATRLFSVDAGTVRTPAGRGTRESRSDRFHTTQGVGIPSPYAPPPLMGARCPVVAFYGSSRLRNSEYYLTT